MTDATPFDGIDEIPQPDFASTALFLDFDGVLVDIADRPDAVRVADGLPEWLDRLDGRFAGGVTLLSGRAIADLDGFLPGRDNAIGGHGAEWRRGGKTGAHPFGRDGRRGDLAAAMDDFAADRPGLLVERKPTGAVLHYRAAPDRADEVRRFIEDLLCTQDDLELHPSKMADEIRPHGVNKGSALKEALATYDAAKAIMIGDDTTDEPAMQAARDSGGFAVKVGEGDTCATHRLADPAAVHAVLRRWAEDSG